MYKTGMVFVFWESVDVIFLPKVTHGRYYIYTLGNYISSHLPALMDKKWMQVYRVERFVGLLLASAGKSEAGGAAVSTLLDGQASGHDFLCLRPSPCSRVDTPTFEL